MATNNKSFRVRHGLDVNSNATVDTSGNANIAGNLTANTGFVSADTFRLDTTYTGGSSQAGEMAWDPDEGTVMFALKDGAVTHRIGQQMDIRVVNVSGSTIPEGAVVYISGSSGQEPTVALANAANEGASSKTIGLVTQQNGIANAASGYLCLSGIMRGVNVGAYTAGTPLWLSNVAGVFTDTKPTPPDNGVFVGWVIKEGNSGSILVHIQNGYEVNELHDVLYTSLAQNDILQRNSANTLWVNKTLAGANIANLAATGLQTFSGNIAGTNFAATGNVNAVTVNATTFTGTAAFATTANAVAVGNVTGLGTNVATFLATPNSLNLLNTVTDETGTGSVVFATSPTLITPNIGAATGTSINVAGQLISTVATGTAPLSVASTTMVQNLTAQVATRVNTLSKISIGGDPNTAFYPIFVDADNVMSAAADLRTDAGFTYFPLNNTLQVTSVSATNLNAATVNVTGQLISTQTTGTAPLAVSSTTKVTNLNADLLDDLNSATANTASTIVARDSGGNIAANTATFVNVTATNGGNLNDGYRLKETLYITSTASFLKASYPYLRAIKVKVVGGGGGGGGTPTTNATSTAIGGSGSGAGYSEFLITDIAGLSATMWSKVGAAGTGGSAGSNAGNDGGASWFGTSNTTTTTTYGHAYGGTGGTAGTAATGNRAIAGVAGAAAGLTGDLKVGGGGSGSIFNAQSNFVHSAIGGSSGLGYSGGAYGEASTTSSVGANAGGYGGGGSGAVAGTGTGTARAGGDGSPGIVILELYA